MSLTLRHPGRLRAASAALLTALVAALLVAPSLTRPARAQDATVAFDRLAGPGRVETAVALSTDAFDAATTVVLARADAYADALAGAPLAAANGAPVLLTPSDVVPQIVLDEIARLGATTAILLGGEAALSAGVADQLTAAGLTVNRLGGGNRFETAVAVAGALTGDTPPALVYFVEGENADPLRGWPDAMSAGWVAALGGAPILPVNGGFVPDAIQAYWDGNADAAGTIVGGTAAVSQEVEDTLGVLDEEGEPTRDLTRVAGGSRFETSALLYDHAVTNLGADPAQRWLATGGGFADALGAGPAVAQLGATLLLVDGGDFTGSPDAAARLTAAADALDRVVLVGGTAAISEAAETAVTGVVNGIVAEDAVEAPFCLTVLHNNDGESQLLGAPAGDDFGGLARFVTLVNQEQAAPAPAGCQAGGEITVTSGDNFLAGPEFQASLELPEGQPIYDAVGLDRVGYDALDLGNHDFDFGPDLTARFIESFATDPTFLSANLDFSAEPALQALVDAGRLAPSTIVDAGGTQVGIIGLTTPNLRAISSPRDVVVGQDILDAVQTQVAALTGAGVEHIVLISHLQGLDSDLELVPQLSGVDVVVAGGGDEILGSPGQPYVPGDETAIFAEYPILEEDADGQTVPIVTTAGDYKYAGRLVVRFDADGELLADDPVNDLRSRMVRVADASLPGGVAEDQFVVDNVYAPIEAFVSGLEAEVIGTTEVALDGSRPAIRNQETNLGNLVADAHVNAALARADEFDLDTANPAVGLQNGGGIRNNNVIPAGQITELTTFDILPFANFVGYMPAVTPEQLKTLLEHGFANVENADGRFPHLSNLVVEVDLSGTAQELAEDASVAVEGSRVTSVTLGDGTAIVTDGAIVADAPDVAMASIDFTFRDGDAYPFTALGLTEFTNVGVSYQQALSEFIQGPLAGAVTAADYPEGGEGRITITGEPAT